ncbi:hypothetical protein ACT3SP_03430 [Brachybacterium sp. AOP43-C2-M15]|uniref:hypothetical protein n=1 Tax=Brachybacterium sp. AOP43-C2-M15 TaxID=3457661 RepID=UPI004034ABC4
MTSHPQGPLPDRGSLQNSSIVLIVLGFLCGGTLPAIFGIISIVQLDSDPYSAKKMNKVGWILFWVLLALIIVGALLYILLMVGVFAVPFLVGV